MMNTDYDFDSNNQDDIIFNGVDGTHSIDEFNDLECDVNDLDNLDYGQEDLR